MQRCNSLTTRQHFVDGFLDVDSTVGNEEVSINALDSTESCLVTMVDVVFNCLTVCLAAKVLDPTQGKGSTVKSTASIL